MAIYNLTNITNSTDFISFATAINDELNKTPVVLFLFGLFMLITISLTRTTGDFEKSLTVSALSLSIIGSIFMVIGWVEWYHNLIYYIITAAAIAINYAK